MQIWSWCWEKTAKAWRSICNSIGVDHNNATVTSKAPQHGNQFKGAVHNRSYSACSDMRIKLELNVSSEEKCFQSCLETVHGWRVANWARQPVPCRRTCDDDCRLTATPPHMQGSCGITVLDGFGIDKSQLSGKCLFRADCPSCQLLFRPVLSTIIFL